LEIKSQSISLKIKSLSPDFELPQYAKPGDAGFDVRALQDYVLNHDETIAIPLGFAVAVPEGYELQIRPRSGLSLRSGLRMSNSIGTIDSGYRGEVHAMLTNTSPNPITIHKFQKIAQGVLNQVPVANFELVDELDSTERGMGGFGHTG